MVVHGRILSNARIDSLHDCCNHYDTYLEESKIVNKIEAYEKRLDAVTEALEHIPEGTWAHQYWLTVYGNLLRKLNFLVHEGESYESFNTHTGGNSTYH